MSNQRQQPLGGSIRYPDVQAVSDPKTLGPATEQTQQFRSPTQSQQVSETQLRQPASQQPIQQQPVQQQPVQQQPVQQQPVQQPTIRQPIQQQPVQQQSASRQPIQQQPVQQQPVRQQAVPLQSQQYAGVLQPRQMTKQSAQEIPVQSVGTQTTARVQPTGITPQTVQQTELAAVPQLVGQPIQQLPQQQQFGQPIQQLPQRQQFGQPIQQGLQYPRQQSVTQRQPLFAGQYDQMLGEKPVGNARQYTTLSGPAAGSDGQFLLAGAQPKSAQIAARRPAQVARPQLAQTTQSQPATTQQPPAEAFFGGFQQSIRPEATQRADFDPSLGRADVTEFGGVTSNVASGVQSSQQPAASKAPATRSGMLAGSLSNAGNGPAVANTTETTESGAM